MMMITPHGKQPKRKAEPPPAGFAAVQADPGTKVEHPVPGHNQPDRRIDSTVLSKPGAAFQSPVFAIPDVMHALNIDF